MPPSTAYYALTFDGSGLIAARPANGHEFPELIDGKRPSLTDVLSDHLANGEASASQLAQETGFSRQRIATELASNKRFCRSRRLGHEVLYALASHQLSPNVVQLDS